MNGDYDDFGVPAELTRQVFAVELQLRGAYRDSLRVGAWLGGLFAQAKDACRHGDFQKWLARHFKASARHARRLMQVAKAYPEPATIPALSLDEALRRIARKEGKQKTVLAHERLSGETCTVMLATFPEVLTLIENGAIGPLELEGVTAKHPAMKAAKKLAADVRRFRELVKCLFPRGQVSAKHESKRGENHETHT